MSQETILHTVDAADADIRLDRWFKRHYASLTHGMLEKSLRKGDIRLDGVKAEASTRLRAGQELAIKQFLSTMGSQAHAPVYKNISTEDAEMLRRAVIHRDANILIINKPPGLATQGGTKITRSVDDMLEALAENGVKPKLVHRLDRDTSGVLVLARNTKAASILMKLFSSRQVEKTYWALVNGCPLDFKGTIDLPLIKKNNPKAEGIAGGPDGRDYEVMQVDEEKGQHATTEYRVVENLARKFALMELKPLTGRTHQLRVHMQAIGCPIVGDHKYGGSMIYDEVTDITTVGVEDKLHLHARRIVIPGSVLGKAIDVSAPLPAHMKQSFDVLGINAPKK